MLISEAISWVQYYCNNIDAFSGKPIDALTTRDKILYGDADQELTGIVTCIWPAANVIDRARELGANLIISHEALFWNHGDHQEPVANNSTYLAKKELLDNWEGVIWRCHDYIHAGVPIDIDTLSNETTSTDREMAQGRYADGIFYGLAWKLGWLNYRIYKRSSCLDYEIPRTTARDLAADIAQKLGLRYVRVVGDLNASVQRIRIPIHVLGGPQDTQLSNAMDDEKIDCVLGMEFIDFTTCEYIRDAAMLGQGKSAIIVGHFNLEEPGMEYMAEWLPRALKHSDHEPTTIEVRYVADGDTYQYVAAAQ